MLEDVLIEARRVFAGKVWLRSPHGKPAFSLILIA